MSAPTWFESFVCGGVAGVCVDVALYPLDTIKTRLQAPQGFWKAGGFQGVYRGLSITALGSAPGAALFFVSYESAKKELEPYQIPVAAKHIAAASCGELMACLVRVPTEVVKQNMQARGGSAVSMIAKVVAKGGAMSLYRGFYATIVREIPFAAIQFPLYERAKVLLRGAREKETSFEAACCGSASGAFAAAVTTPLDVIKTRLMLGADANGSSCRSTNFSPRPLFRGRGVRRFDPSHRGDDGDLDDGTLQKNRVGNHSKEYAHHRERSEYAPREE